MARHAVDHRTTRESAWTAKDKHGTRAGIVQVVFHPGKGNPVILCADDERVGRQTTAIQRV